MAQWPLTLNLFDRPECTSTLEGLWFVRGPPDSETVQSVNAKYYVQHFCTLESEVSEFLIFSFCIFAVTFRRLHVETSIFLCRFMIKVYYLNFTGVISVIFHRFDYYYTLHHLFIYQCFSYLKFWTVVNEGIDFFITSSTPQSITKKKKTHKYFFQMTVTLIIKYVY